MDLTDVLEIALFLIVALCIVCWVCIGVFQCDWRSTTRRVRSSSCCGASAWQFNIIEADIDPQGAHYLWRLKMATKVFFGLIALFIVVTLMMMAITRA